MFRFVRACTAKVFLPASLQANDDLSDFIEEVENTIMLDCVFGEHEYDARTTVEEGYISLTLNEELDSRDCDVTVSNIGRRMMSKQRA